MIRKIVTPIRADGESANLLAHAAAVAHRFTAHVEAVHCRPRPTDFLPFGVTVPDFLREQISDNASSLADAEEKKLRQEFTAAAAALNLTLADGPNGETATAAWREAEGKQVDVLKVQGRLADLIVVAKPDRDRNLGANTLKSALFNTGRPVLMCPQALRGGATPPLTLGATVSIAWNGSTEAARAVALTLDLIQAADTVWVITVGDMTAHGAGAEDLAAYLALRGVATRLERVDAASGVGDALMRRRQELGADLMIMGAYGDSHERETIFGGNTQKIVDETDAPVILVH